MTPIQTWNKAIEEAAKVADKVAEECGFDAHHNEDDEEARMLASGGQIEAERIAKKIRALKPAASSPPISDELVERLERLEGLLADRVALPIRGVDGPDYAELLDANDSKIALTVQPELLIEAINSLPMLINSLRGNHQALSYIGDKG